MKNINKLLFSLTMLLIVWGCEETEFETTEDNLGNFVSFSQSSASVSESVASGTADGISVITGGNYVIEVVRSGRDLSQPLTVNISSSITFASSTDFADSGDDASETVFFSQPISTVTIPSGETSALVDVNTINDEFSSGDKTVALTITGTSDASFNLGAPATGVGNSLTITVVDDDCPIDLTSFEGAYTMTIVGTPGARFEGFDGCTLGDCSPPAMLAADPTDPLLQTAIITHPEIGGEYKIKFVTCPLETTVVQPMTSFLGRSTWLMEQGTVPGSYDDNSKDISIVGLLGGNGNFTISLKKN